MPKGCSVGLMIGVLMFIIGLVLWFCSTLTHLTGHSYSQYASQAATGHRKEQT